MANDPWVFQKQKKSARVSHGHETNEKEKASIPYLALTFEEFADTTLGDILRMIYPQTSPPVSYLEMSSAMYVSHLPL